jgi:homocysteine S-methyltransferase
MPVILDGGLSTALAEQGHDLTHPLWTARLLSENTAAIVAAHRSFLDAGAEVLITSSYQASVDGFVRNGATPDEARALLQSTTGLARQAIGSRSAVLAASVGPYGAVLADGSEYRGDYALSNGELVAFHRERVRLLAETEPDWWACETIPTAAEAVAMGLALSTVRRLPTWMTFTCQSGSHTFGGDRIEDAITAALSTCDLSAVGVNCTAPGFVPELLQRIRRVTDLPLVAYPNGGGSWDVDNKVWLGDHGATDVTAWIAAGAEYVGGCCGVGPAELANLARLARR